MSVETARGVHMAERIRTRLRDKLAAAEEIALASEGRLPRAEYKSKLPGRQG